MTYIMLIAGFALLFGGAEFLVRGSVAIAARMGISPMVIGMTVVAFGTSAPEFVVSLNAALSGSSVMAVGNLVGSNIANILLILGVAGLIAPIISSDGKGYRRDTVVLLVGTMVFVGIAQTGEIARWGGAVLLVIFSAFLVYSYRREIAGDPEKVAESHAAEIEEFKGLEKRPLLAVVATLAGLVGVALGADWLVTAGVEIALAYGVSEAVIGLTLIAIGTSLPELAASGVAAFRGHAELALGNVVGSNLFNLLFVAGGVSLITPLSVSDELRNLDVWIMLGVTLALVPFLLGWLRFRRLLAGVFLAAYGSYLWFLIAQGSPALPL